jgi:hypothetical protein
MQPYAGIRNFGALLTQIESYHTTEEPSCNFVAITQSFAKSHIFCAIPQLFVSNPATLVRHHATFCAIKKLFAQSRTQPFAQLLLRN